MYQLEKVDIIFFKMLMCL